MYDLLSNKIYKASFLYLVMSSVQSMNAGKYNLLLAEALKDLDEFQRPAWLSYVKSGAGKMRPIEDPDFWHKRGASILRQMYVRGILGVGRLRTRYGHRKNRGMKPARHYKGSGKIVRLLLQQAESAGLIEKVKGKRSGRQLTFKGKQLLESVK